MEGYFQKEFSELSTFVKSRDLHFAKHIRKISLAKARRIAMDQTFTVINVEDATINLTTKLTTLSMSPELVIFFPARAFH